ncbi:MULTISPECIES: hypothetical protein [Thermomonosporaceae]|uniref:hypothetical protein n=1 Tax=Thermomonosporaceae TaxID=2012 RepID=UPI00255B0BC5|nr:MULTISPECIES: hypothetical protein [Thermomonosporaceae]MDL4773845.1 hypothetical protein [Actinomadura xylanilytica]
MISDEARLPALELDAIFGLVPDPDGGPARPRDATLRAVSICFSPASNTASAEAGIWAGSGSCAEVPAGDIHPGAE